MDENIFTIIGIDPGSNIGISIYHIDARDFSIVKIETRLVVLNNHTKAEDALDKVLEKLMYLHKVCLELQYAYEPQAVIIESAFLNIRFPKAVIQLSQYIATIETTFRQENPMVKIYRFPPKVIKKVFSDNGAAAKDDMLTAISKVNEVNVLVDTNTTSEHEIDAIAIGYVGITLFRLKPHLLFGYF